MSGGSFVYMSERRLRLVASNPYQDQVKRQEQFREAHPEVGFFMTTYKHHGAQVPGQEPIIRVDLRLLLDALDRIYEP